jgi:hypothetical protein
VDEVGDVGDLDDVDDVDDVDEVDDLLAAAFVAFLVLGLVDLGALGTLVPVFLFTLHLPVLPHTHSPLVSHSGCSFMTEHLLPPPNISVILRCCMNVCLYIFITFLFGFIFFCLNSNTERKKRTYPAFWFLLGSWFLVLVQSMFSASGSA